LLGAIWLKESPRWLFANNKREKAMQNLCWIRGDLPADHPYILEEVEAIERQVEHDRIHVGAGFWKPFLALKQRKVAFRFLLGGGLFLWYVNTRSACGTIIDLGLGKMAQALTPSTTIRPPYSRALVLSAQTLVSSPPAFLVS
jgi:hypothetical protein